MQLIESATTLPENLCTVPNRPPCHVKKPLYMYENDPRQILPLNKSFVLKCTKTTVEEPSLPARDGATTTEKANG